MTRSPRVHLLDPEDDRRTLCGHPLDKVAMLITPHATLVTCRICDRLMLEQARVERQLR